MGVLQEATKYINKAAISIGDHFTSHIKLESWETEHGEQGMIVRDVDAKGKVTWDIKPLDHSLVAGSDL